VSARAMWVRPAPTSPRSKSCSIGSTPTDRSSRLIEAIALGRG
jgi:hypothetical protein